MSATIRQVEEMMSEIVIEHVQSHFQNSIERHRYDVNGINITVRYNGLNWWVVTPSEIELPNARFIGNTVTHKAWIVY